jgi:outer membrane biogenesis lipoprotein LolB
MVRRYMALALFASFMIAACAAEQPKPMNNDADQAAMRAEEAAKRAEAAAAKAATSADKSEAIFHKGMQK